MSYLASFVALLVQKLWPWATGVIASAWEWIANWWRKKQEDSAANSQREEATKKLQDSIDNKVPREERQKNEQDMLNS